MRVLACPGCGTRVGVPEGAAPYCPKCGFGREKKDDKKVEKASSAPPLPSPAATSPTAPPTPATRPATRTAAPSRRRAARLRVPRRKGKGLVLADPYEDVEDGPGFAVAVGVAVGAGVLAVVGAYYFWVLV